MEGRREGRCEVLSLGGGGLGLGFFFFFYVGKLLFVFVGSCSPIYNSHVLLLLHILSCFRGCWKMLEVWLTR
jgi:hypothetical protein